MKPGPDLLFVVLAVSLESISSKQHLKCYHCWWSHADVDSSSEVQDEKDLPYPVAKRFVGGEGTSPPSREEMEKLCIKETCKSTTNSFCLKWTYTSGSPINITYKCVGNPKRKSGCYQQQIKTKEYKQYVKVEACLCDNSNFCNRSVVVTRNLCLLGYLTLLVLFLGR